MVLWDSLLSFGGCRIVLSGYTSRIVEIRSTKEERDLTKDIYASWSAQNWHDPVSNL